MVRFKQTYNQSSFSFSLAENKNVNADLFGGSNVLKEYINGHSDKDKYCSFSEKSPAISLVDLLKYVVKVIDCRFSEAIDGDYEHEEEVNEDSKDEIIEGGEERRREDVRIEGSKVNYVDILFGLRLNTVNKELNELLIKFLKENNIVEKYPKITTINNDIVWYWEKFREDLTTQRRFTYFAKKTIFPMKAEDDPNGEKTFDLIKECINNARISNSKNLTLYRCRDFSNQQERFCIKNCDSVIDCWCKQGRGKIIRYHCCDGNVVKFDDLTSPPSSFAKANRWSPSGISMFYGADDLTTAKKEIGNPSFCVYGVFSSKSAIKLLDLSTIPADIDFWSKDWENLKMLDSFEKELSKPISEKDADTAYLPTQAFAEYIRYSETLNVKGIIYRSAKIEEERNVVLFMNQQESRKYLKLKNAWLLAYGTKYRVHFR